MQENILDFREEQQQRPGQEAPPPGGEGSRRKRRCSRSSQFFSSVPQSSLAAVVGGASPLSIVLRTNQSADVMSRWLLAPAGSTSCLRLCPLLLHFLSAGVAAPPTGSEVQKVMLRWEGLCVWVGGVS